MTTALATRGIVGVGGSGRGVGFLVARGKHDPRTIWGWGGVWHISMRQWLEGFRKSRNEGYSSQRSYSQRKNRNPRGSAERRKT